LVSPTRLTWVCCAATAATRRAAFPADEPLEDGPLEDGPLEDGPLEDGTITEVQAAAAGLDRCDRVFAGPELRVRQTVDALGLQVSIEPALRECDFGRWAGRSLREVEALEPDALASWLTDMQAAPHGGESLAHAMQRVSDWLEGPARKYGRVAAISHPSVIRAAIVHVIGAPATSFWRIDVIPLGRTHMSHDGKAWRLRTVE